MAINWITPEDTHDPSNPNTAYYIETASWILYKLTAEKYPGITERREWYGVERAYCGSCVSLEKHGHVYYRSTSTDKIRLRGTPVREIISVTHDGVLLTPDMYRVTDSMFLSMLSSDCWNLAKGVEVVYTSGIRPPEAGIQAAIRLTNELILASTSPTDCALPDRVTSVSRQGVDYTILDPQDFLKEGRTGLYEVDLFIKVANPINAKKKPRVFSVDRPRGHSLR